MAANFDIHRYERMRPNKMALFAVGLMLLAVVVSLFILTALGGAFDNFQYLFLLPWVLALAVVIGIPLVILYYKGEFYFGNPIVFASLSYFIPAFVVGGFLLAAGFSEPYFLSYIQDQEYNLPLTVALTGLGFSCLALGYFAPIGAKLGGMVSKALPVADYSPASFVLPGIMLLLLGIANTIFAFAVGLFGYQLPDQSSAYAGIIFLSTLFRLQGGFLLWLVIFRQRTFNTVSIALMIGMATVDLISALFAGNRGTILTVVTTVLFAYVFSGRKFGLKQGLFAGAVLAIGLVIGMIYGTTFRMVKGTEAQQSAGQYTENIFKTFDTVGRSDTYDNVSFGLTSLSERLDIVSTLAVVVSNYEQLKPYEEAYGIDNNIWVDTTTFLIPRVIWTEKPAASDPRNYSDLYFNTANSSFAITPIGDLLRNYGVVGIAIGMFILGMVIRFIYSALITPGTTPVWKVTFYFMLITSVSYEGFFGTIVPTLYKVGFTALVGVLLVTFLARRIDSAARPDRI